MAKRSLLMVWLLLSPDLTTDNAGTLARVGVPSGYGIVTPSLGSGITDHHYCLGNQTLLSGS